MQLWYAIGVAEPVSVLVIGTWNKGHSQEEAEQFIKENYDLTPKGIIDFLDLRKPIYRKTAENWHFTNEEFLREKIKL